MTLGTLEGDPIIETEDGILEPVNRRVEIEIMQGDDH